MCSSSWKTPTSSLPYGQVTTIIQKMLQLEDSCWADARRKAFITLRDGVKHSLIPARLNVKAKGVVTHVYLTYGIKCFLCKRANCSRKTGLQEDKLLLPVDSTGASTKAWTEPLSNSNCSPPVATPPPALLSPQILLPARQRKQKRSLFTGSRSYGLTRLLSSTSPSGSIAILYGEADLIQVENVYTKAFPLLNGMRQGCRLSAALSSIGVGPLLRRLESILGRRSVVAYADDFVLFIREDTQFELLPLIFEASGMAVNFIKSCGICAPALARSTRAVLQDAQHLRAFCQRLLQENASSSYHAEYMAETIVLRESASLITRLTSQSSRLALDSARLQAHPVTKLAARWTSTVDMPRSIPWANLRRNCFSGHNADVALRLALHALPYPDHPASRHRYWSCRDGRHLLRDVFTSCGLPLDLQAWLFGVGLHLEAIKLTDLAPCDFLFPKVELLLKGIKFDTDDEALQAFINAVNSILEIDWYDLDTPLRYIGVSWVQMSSPGGGGRKLGLLKAKRRDLSQMGDSQEMVVPPPPPPPLPPPEKKLPKEKPQALSDVLRFQRQKLKRTKTREKLFLPSKEDHSISTRTISRRLVANGLHSCRPLRRLPLTPPNRRQRLEWCRARSTWMTEWHRVVFSDESRFCLSSDSRRVRVWRRRGERSNPAAIVERPTVRQRGIMFWGAIAYDSRSPLLRIQGTMTAQRYVDDVLRPVTLPYLQGVPNALYQQDNARPHTARISQQALQDVQMLPWPPYSPDLSPIEHVWDIIGRRLHALPQPRSEDELWQMVEREWRAIPQDAIRTLIDSLPRRVAACIAVRGGPTFY
ncbi:Transposase [Cordylochernes scorpioides]|uniref:Transposase n=1 Tax=Cordylochernes scorpioides TaxID=51811 RepID=A0ABY6L3J8_9ARAC|nr:Transposase [Cordylochernes scorpioides]